METRIASSLRDQPGIGEAEAVLRSCVHCGFCTATCPTYLLLGDERDGPRGRIYLLKALLETARAGEETRSHLDRCLECRACETTCPSGVRYARLLETGRTILDRIRPRPLHQRLFRRLLKDLLPWPSRLGPLVAAARLLRPVLPATLRRRLPPAVAPDPAPRQPRALARRMLLLEGCVQSVATPATNRAARRVFGHLDIGLESPRQAGCCGALHHHLGDREGARRLARRNIDAWWPRIEQGAEAILATASGCALFLGEYGRLLADDPHYRDKAGWVSSHLRDPAQVLADEGPALPRSAHGARIALHTPCTLCHGLHTAATLRELLRDLGWQLQPTADDHLCCGSAGPYSLLQPRLARRLRQRKLAALGVRDRAPGPETIVTANVGCQLHLQAGTDVPVRHWLEVLAEDIDPDGGPAVDRGRAER